MRLFQLVIRIGALGCILAALGAGMEDAAWCAERPPESAAPLLVVVETGPGAGCDAAAVRAAIAAELRARVIAPMASPGAAPVVALAGPRAEMLLVAVDRERIVVTLRGRDDQEITRAMAAPADKAGKLRVVAWLAGNLARDQIAPLTTAAPVTAAAADDGGARLPVTPLAAAPAPEPAPMPVPPVSPPTGAPAIVRAVPAGAPSPGATWTFSLGGGAAAMFASPWESEYQPSPGGVSWNDSWQLEGQRHSGGPLFFGAAIDLGPRSVHPLGVAALAGMERRGQHFFVAGSLGVGVQAFLARTYYVESSAAPAVGGSGNDNSVTDRKAVAYFRAALMAGYALTPAWDVIAQLGGHLAATESADAAFALTTIGLRFKLQ